jgi:type VI secretion system Hcp family effector
VGRSSDRRLVAAAALAAVDSAEGPTGGLIRRIEGRGQKVAISHYAVFVPYDGTPLTGEGTTAGLVDPFRAGVDPQAFFPINSWSFDIEQTLNIGSQSTGAGAGKVTFNPFSINRKIDKMSPTLFRNAAAGTPFQYVDLIEHRAGKNGDRAAFAAWQFQLVAVKTVSWASEDDDRPGETVTFEYGALTMRYVPQSPTGQLEPPVQAGWDRVRNVAL